METRRHFEKLEREGDAAKDMLDEVMMYTYVDRDNFKLDQVCVLFFQFPCVSTLPNRY
jgi:hypothetical protein